MYRGYPVGQLASQCSFEEVAYLLLYGDLPSAGELRRFCAEERESRGLDPRVRQVIDLISPSAHPMHVLRTAVSMLGAVDTRSDRTSPREQLTDAVRLLAKIPAIIAYDRGRRRGRSEPPEPQDDLGYCENFLFMTFGSAPPSVVVDAFRVAMILYAENELNSSTFTARVIASTRADLYSSVTGAIAALEGSLHGGANEAVIRMLESIGDAGQVESWVDDALAKKLRVPGFGHRVFRNGDPRAAIMRAASVGLIDYSHGDALDSTSVALESSMLARARIRPNVDYPVALVFQLIGFDKNTFTTLFAASRMSGWLAHILEQRESKTLISPSSRYVGPEIRDIE